jgi:hypothetical protein
LGVGRLVDRSSLFAVPAITEGIGVLLVPLIAGLFAAAIVWSIAALAFKEWVVIYPVWLALAGRAWIRGNPCAVFTGRAGAVTTA